MMKSARIVLVCAAVLAIAIPAAAYFYQSPEPSAIFLQAPSTDTPEQTNERINRTLSRTALTTVIRNLDLYRDEMQRMPMEDVVEIMRQAIAIERAPNDLLKVEYRGANAKAVTERLAQIFIGAGFVHQVTP